MALKNWKGGATAVAQVVRLTPGGTIAGGNEFKVTLTDEGGNAHLLTVVATGTTVAATCADIVTAFNASTDPRFTGITAAAIGSPATAVSLTADVAGVPFYCTVAVGTGSQTLNTTITTANVGPKDWNTAANWAQGAVPVASDDVLLSGSGGVSYGLDQSGVALHAIGAGGFSGTVGAAGQPLKLACTSLQWAGSGTAYLDLGSSAIAPVILPGAGQVNIVGGSALTTLDVLAGTVNIAPDLDQTATVATVRNAGATVNIGSGCTLTTYRQMSGRGTIKCAATTATIEGGQATTSGTGAITTLNVSDGAKVYPNSTGTITTLNANGGTTDFTGSLAARAVTTLNRKAGAVVKLDQADVTVTNLALTGPVRILDA